MSGVELATQVRLDRAKFRMRVEAGEVAAWKIIEDPPAFVLTTTVFEYVTWLPGVGKERGSVAFKLLRKARVESHMRIGELTLSQRQRLSAVIHAVAYPTGRGTHPAEKGWT